MDLDTLEAVKGRLNLSSISKPALIGIVALIVLVAAIAGARMIGAATANEFQVVKADAQSDEGAEEGKGAEAATVFIHVSGAVSSPGLYELESGSRVADAISAAGGFAEDAEEASVNLARPLSDGEQLAVAREEDGASAVATASQVQEPGSAAGGKGPLVNINTADVSQLETLPGIGEALAKRIIADRQAQGMFKTVDDLKRVSGIGDKKFESLSALICV